MNNHNLKAIVPLNCHGHRLDKVLAYLFPQYSRTYLKRQIDNAKVFVNSHCIKKSDTPAFSNQAIDVLLSVEPLHTTWQKNTSITLSLVYEDDALLVINKPPGLVTHPALGHLDDTLANALLHYLPALSELPRAGIIHRLDKDTSGLLVIPKNIAIYHYLVKELAARKIERIYQAIVKGHFVTSGTVDLPLGRHPKLRQKQAVVSNGKPSVTHYRILERFKHHTLLRVQLETGRTHQIRVHMAHIAHPVVGDPLYGRRTTLKELSFKRQALHATRLRLVHPLTKRWLCCEAPLPCDMRELIVALREETGGE